MQRADGLYRWHEGLSGRHLRAARGLLNWSVKEVAQRVCVSTAIIWRIEEYSDTPMSDAQRESLRKTFVDAGIKVTLPVVGKPRCSAAMTLHRQIEMAINRYLFCSAGGQRRSQESTKLSFRQLLLV
ncbi:MULTISPECIES: helix-turn-helix domain-containing protein [Bradyrhizobium]|uniref:Helix-turn-helix domain-containing protein n=1 Tax=Bradyrhizobium zhengyangense TaxID=2911009 RepID=A0A9X1R5U7_9BRAD|nr:MULTISPECIES: helix-turn-helix domain-containing protein [Bradyrhizobium]MCG2628072.1 helix-turn-helix domain-containing protein [Bradyrhizobium zhengyangense]MCG2670495.1 helix-turn-helix domain-containing protein [Bradyrhizobium zhengyangense]MDN4985770.1 helix-turn-helix domain-containing protein [Bradyrhizobium sp. WYCCWR 13022]MDT4736611.1 helix-turn-helix domain-containing protein [Bradyrhizobium sp. WYCCWR 12699]